MAIIPNRKLAIAAAGIVSDVQGVTYTNLGTAGTVVAVPANAWGVQLINGTAPLRFKPGTAMGTANLPLFPASGNLRLALHGAGSVAVAAGAGSADVTINWLIAADGP